MKNSKLEIISTQIRKDIPRLMELREGCFVKHKKYDWVRKIIYKENDTIITIDVSNKSNEIFTYKYKNDFEVENYEIIGYNIMLNDVLEWLHKVANKYQFRVESDGKINFDTSLDEDLYWNLSSPYLKDQNKELIEFLYSLIEQ